MQKSFLKSFLLVAATVLATAFGPAAFAQVVTSGITGLVRSGDGKIISGATVTAVHTPTNASHTTTSNASGRYSFTGLPVGGPYTLTVKADGLSSEPLTDITTELGSSISVDLIMKSDVVQLEKFVATGACR